MGHRLTNTTVAQDVDEVSRAAWEASPIARIPNLGKTCAQSI